MMKFRLQENTPTAVPLIVLKVTWKSLSVFSEASNTTQTIATSSPSQMLSMFGTVTATTGEEYQHIDHEEEEEEEEEDDDDEENEKKEDRACITIIIKGTYCYYL